MAKKGKPKKRAPGKRPQPAKRPIAAGPARPASPDPDTSPSGPGKPTRAERIEAARRARHRKKLQLRISIAGAAALLIGALVANAVGNRSDTTAFRKQLTAGSCTFDTHHDAISPPPNNHVAPASYKVNPPAGGNHDPNAAQAGKYEAADAPPEAQVVHALEHGYVAIWHRPDLPKKDLDTITKVFDRYENDVLVVPRASLPSGTKVAVTAWGERLLCQNAELGPLTEFVKKYRNEGPEKVPHT